MWRRRRRRRSLFRIVHARGRDSTSQANQPSICGSATAASTLPRAIGRSRSGGGGMDWSTTITLGGWPLVRSPSLDDSAVSSCSRLVFGPVPPSRSGTHGIGRVGHYQGLHLPLLQGPATRYATPTPLDEHTELVWFHHSTKGPTRSPLSSKAHFRLDRSLAINEG